jgi:hypothetical protein
MILKTLKDTKNKVEIGAKLVAAILVLIVALQGIILWLLLTRLPAS